MFQTRGVNTEQEFNRIITGFKKFILNEAAVETNKSEWNLELFYKPKWACIWNKIDNIGRKCMIDVKDDQFAIVIWNKEEGLLESIYRLEDLEVII